MAILCVVGAGYVGLTTALGLAELGHTIRCLDRNPERVSALARLEVYLSEPGMQESLQAQTLEGRFFPTESPEEAMVGAEAIFICVDTPQAPSGEANLSAVTSVMEEIASLVSTQVLVVLKSTVPPGTALAFEGNVPNHIEVASNPEFLREGSAMWDFHNPDRIIIGSSSKQAQTQLQSIYSPLESALVLTDLTSAEIIKYAANTMLASRLSLVNEFARICSIMGGSISDVTKGLALDPRIGELFLAPGPGWGGSCFPKDVAAISFVAQKAGLNLPMISSLTSSNSSTQDFVANEVANLASQLSQKRVGIWGLTFKAGTDDLRDSPALAIIDNLVSLGFEIYAYDPTVRTPFVGKTESLHICESAEQLLSMSKLLVVLTEWPEFADFVPESSVCEGLTVFDSRLILDKESWLRAGANLVSFGGTSP
jgi:UDPglucose 6-dehydrogenase